LQMDLIESCVNEAWDVAVVSDRVSMSVMQPHRSFHTL
jgi:hypothetical protein